MSLYVLYSMGDANENIKGREKILWNYEIHIFTMTNILNAHSVFGPSGTQNVDKYWVFSIFSACKALEKCPWKVV